MLSQEIESLTRSQGSLVFQNIQQATNNIEQIFQAISDEKLDIFNAIQLWDISQHLELVEFSVVISYFGRIFLLKKK